jgi:hypothetical protein
VNCCGVLWCAVVCCRMLRCGTCCGVLWRSRRDVVHRCAVLCVNWFRMCLLQRAAQCVSCWPACWGLQGSCVGLRRGIWAAAAGVSYV